MQIGITGGIGCGKSTAARFFERHGFRRIDADEQVKQLLLPRPDVIAAIAEKFGKGVLTAVGQVDRAALASIVFADEEALRWLENLLHPLLFIEWRRVLAEERGNQWIFEVPLLFEKRLENWFDFTVCVATSSTFQLTRLAERGMSRALAEQRISKQLPLAQKIEFADFVLSNDGSLSFLQAQVARLVEQLSVRR
jgi:dephospho-CoA kinase